jgi:hypothetical protein
MSKNLKKNKLRKLLSDCAAEPAPVYFAASHHSVYRVDVGGWLTELVAATRQTTARK